ncbi:MAG TPA: tripartite tricarboxylate transporter TctB family protein [Rectinemataceae bacterium]
MTKNMISGIVAIVVGVIYLITTMLLPEMKMGDKLGPKLFPSVAGFLALGSGVALVILDFISKKPKEKADFGFIKRKDVWIKIFLTTVVGVVYGLLMDPLGFIIPTTLFMLFISTLINKGRLVQNIIVAVAFSVICYGVFGVALKLSLPRGFLEQLLPF